jgi:hypothetical protein
MALLTFFAMLPINSFMKLPQFFSMVVVAGFGAFLPIHCPAAGARVTQDFDANWLFSKGNFAAAMMPVFDDGSCLPR